MRDGLSRPPGSRNPTGTSTTSGDVSVDHWRARLRAGVLGELAEDPTITASLLPIDGGILIVQLPRD